MLAGVEISHTEVRLALPDRKGVISFPAVAAFKNSPNPALLVTSRGMTFDYMGRNFAVGEAVKSGDTIIPRNDPNYIWALIAALLIKANFTVPFNLYASLSSDHPDTTSQDLSNVLNDFLRGPFRPVDAAGKIYHIHLQQFNLIEPYSISSSYSQYKEMFRVLQPFWILHFNYMGTYLTLHKPNGIIHVDNSAKISIGANLAYSMIKADDRTISELQMINQITGWPQGLARKVVSREIVESIGRALSEEIRRLEIKQPIYVLEEGRFLFDQLREQTSYLSMQLLPPGTLARGNLHMGLMYEQLQKVGGAE
ncbi:MULTISPECIES: hypothetical protein [unclassified Paenibacillus]|uniref:hypothetical protein n=1 Tax=unclassified Paenibacillus TaxID=185978 RepID=UPI00020D7628|nr:MULTISPECIES: hypothetical protein [unclassified Paenibacillus]EGL15067.1 hypothetical protein HMPREF9413_5735 [Paenibacillus sp. HGF7]EPD80466.1 hypothetical protein HMPREF1207_05681 [Paenibacillus sp. HGH0039]